MAKAKVYKNNAWNEILGGGTLSEINAAQDVNIPASTTTNLLKLTDLDSNGVYLIVAQIGFLPNASGGRLTAAIGSSASNLNINRTETWVGATANHYLSVPALVTNRTSVNLNIHATVAGKSIQAGTFIKAIRLR